MSIIWLNKEELFPTVAKQISYVDIILDIGCGIRPQNYICPRIHICCEPFEEYRGVLLDIANQQTDRRFIILNADWEETVKLFSSKSVDTIFLLDVIEHLDKEKGEKLLCLTESIARKQIVIFTPLGFVPQSHPDGIDAWGLHGGAWQEHKSGWLPEDFDESWDIYACKEFHSTDHNGILWDKPYGAFWAIKNINHKENENICIFIECNFLLEDNVIPRIKRLTDSICNQKTENLPKIYIVLLIEKGKGVTLDPDTLNVNKIISYDPKDSSGEITGIVDFMRSTDINPKVCFFMSQNHYFVESNTLKQILYKYRQGYNFILPRIYSDCHGFQEFEKAIINPILVFTPALFRHNNILINSPVNDSSIQCRLLVTLYSNYIHARIKPLHDKNIIAVYDDNNQSASNNYDKKSINIELTAQWLEISKNEYDKDKSITQYLNLEEYISYPDMNDIQKLSLLFLVFIRKLIKKIKLSFF